MNKDRVKGKSKEIEGRVLRGVGKATGSRKTQAKGAVKQAEGQLQGMVGRMKDAVAERKRAREAQVEVVRTTRSTTVRRKRR